MSLDAAVTHWKLDAGNAALNMQLDGRESETVESSNRIAVLVLGMHRSGTSSIAGALVRLGGGAPRNLLPPQLDNPRGFWESSVLVNLNEEILAAAGSSWRDWRAFDSARIDADAQAALRARAKAALTDEFGDASLAIVKDPRMCRLMPFWSSVLEEAGWSVRPILPLRSPLEVAMSLNRRDGMALSHGCLLWLRHMLDAEAETRDMPRAVVVWDEFLRDRGGVLEQLGVRLDLTWPRWSNSALGEIEEFVSVDLRREKASEDDLRLHPAVSDLVRKTNAALLDLAQDPSNGRAWRSLDEARIRFEDATAIFGRAMFETEEESRRFRSLARQEQEEQARQHAAERDSFASELANARGEFARELDAVRNEFTRKLEAAQNDFMRRLDARRDSFANQVDALQQAIGAELATVRHEFASQLAAERDNFARQLDVAGGDLSTQLVRMQDAIAGSAAAHAEQIAHLKDVQQQRLRLEVEARQASISELTEQLSQSKAAMDMMGADWSARAAAGVTSLLARLKRPDYDGRLPSGLRTHRPLLSKRRSKLVRDYREIALSMLFDARWYLDTNPDVASAGIDAAEHYLRIGSAEGRDPGPHFSTISYLRANPDVAAVAVNPLLHFLRYGAREHRPLEPAKQLFDPGAGMEACDTSKIALAPQQRNEEVDIIICVHNAFDDIRRCLESVVAKTLPPYHLILVDDGSEATTGKFLSTFAEIHGAALVHHDVAKGYTLAANAGLQMSSAPFCVLLNSDTEVSEGWLDRLFEYMRRDQTVGVVGPLSNTASWQSVPSVFDGDDWAGNELPEGMNVEDMARLVALGSSRRGIQLGFINGFCMLIRRPTIEKVGVFDHEAFGAGYGEENDFCIRARRAGWRLIVADDAYVFHHQSRSYTDRRRELAARADQILANKHSPAVDILPHVLVCRNSLMLLHARLRVRANLGRAVLSARGRRRFETRRIAFLLPVLDAGGGANVILQEIGAMRRFGVDAWIVNRTENRQGFERSYPGLEIPVLYGEGDLNGEAERILAAHGVSVDAIVASSFESFYWLPEASSTTRLGYYIQDVETLFFPTDAPMRERAAVSYIARPDVIRVTKSAWNRDGIIALGGYAPTLVGASVDIDLFHPRNDDGLDANRPPHVVTMVRPETRRRAPHLTLRVLRRLKDRFQDKVAVTCFGGFMSDIASLGIPLEGIGVVEKLAPGKVAELLGRADVFLDFSEWQALGLTALEAMVSGAAVVVPRRGAASENCPHGVAGLVVDSTDEEACFDAACKLVMDAELRLAVRRAGMENAMSLAPESAALTLLEALWGAE